MWTVSSAVRAGFGTGRRIGPRTGLVTVVMVPLVVEEEPAVSRVRANPSRADTTPTPRGVRQQARPLPFA
ncbi:hypothetical protein GCM10023175_03470 [Pseudonocardia xishanensis]|uniref:Uncharacterized protein n=1 Tax=Pseudonocardia xishanensis TaxID=630995 RepID=A0ABP8RDX6_9PSEU